MWENQNPEHSAQPESSPAPEVIKPTYEELERAVSNLNDMLRESNAKTQRLIDWEYKAEKLEEWLDEEGDSLTKRQIDEICEIFDFDTEITKTITVEASFELEITAERGFSFDDLDEGDFSVSIERSYSRGDWKISSENSAEVSDISVED
jgi:hypothetical protein